MCRRQQGAATDHGYPCSVNSGSILLEFYRHATVTQALTRIISTVNTHSYVSHFEERASRPMQHGPPCSARVASLRTVEGGNVLQSSQQLAAGRVQLKCDGTR